MHRVVNPTSFSKDDEYKNDDDNNVTIKRRHQQLLSDSLGETKFNLPFSSDFRDKYRSMPILTTTTKVAAASAVTYATITVMYKNRLIKDSDIDVGRSRCTALPFTLDVGSTLK